MNAFGYREAATYPGGPPSQSASGLHPTADAVTAAQFFDVARQTAAGLFGVTRKDGKPVVIGSGPDLARAMESERDKRLASPQAWSLPDW